VVWYLEMQSWVTGPVEIFRGHLAGIAILADNHERRIHNDARQPRGKCGITLELFDV
jgi:hypothetical protein